MNFNFIPFKLNAELNQYKQQIKYISADNGVELYKVRDGLKIEILGILVSDVNLYFFEASLITVYIHLNERPDNIERIREIFEKEIGSKGRTDKTDSNIVCNWVSENDFLGLKVNEKSQNSYIYLTTHKFNIHTIN
ncbi:MAG: hypothetical protein ABL872_01445 [Lacibacter sp.]